MDFVLFVFGWLVYDVLDSERSTLTKVIAACVLIVLLVFSFVSTFNVATPDGGKTPKVEETKIEDGPKADF